MVDIMFHMYGCSKNSIFYMNVSVRFDFAKHASMIKFIVFYKHVRQLSFRHKIEGSNMLSRDSVGYSLIYYLNLDKTRGGTYTVYMRCYLPQKATIPRKGEPYA